MTSISNIRKGRHNFLLHRSCTNTNITFKHDQTRCLCCSGVLPRYFIQDKVLYKEQPNTLLVLQQLLDPNFELDDEISSVGGFVTRAVEKMINDVHQFEANGNFRKQANRFYNCEHESLLSLNGDMNYLISFMPWHVSFGLRFVNVTIIENLVIKTDMAIKRQMVSQLKTSLALLKRARIFVIREKKWKAI